MRIDDIEIAIRGRLLRTARLRNEWYDYAPDPAAFLARLRLSGINADLFTFLAEIPDRARDYPYAAEPDPAAVIP